MVVGVWLFNAPARLSLFPARPVDSRCALPCTSATRQPVGVALEIFGPVWVAVVGQRWTGWAAGKPNLEVSSGRYGQTWIANCWSRTIRLSSLVVYCWLLR